MSNMKKYLNRRDMLKFGITAVGITAMPKGALSCTGITSQKTEGQIEKARQNLHSIAKKYGGEFGGIEPKAGRE